MEAKRTLTEITDRAEPHNLDRNLKDLSERELTDLALTYRSCTDLQMNDSALYTELKRRNIYDNKVKTVLVERNLQAGYTYVTDEALLDKALRYDGRMALTRADRKLREELERRGLWDDALPRRRKKWTEETLTAEAARYETAHDMSKGNFAAYRAAFTANLLPKFFPEFNGSLRERKWSPDVIAEHAQLCASRTDFHKKFPGAYKAAHALGIIEDVCKHMPFHSSKSSPAGMSNLELEQTAREFDSADAFLRGNRNAYVQVVRRGIFSKISEDLGW